MPMDKIAPIANGYGSLGLYSRRRWFSGLCLVVECLHLFLAEIHGPADGAAGLAQHKPGNQTFGVEFMTADLQLEDLLGPGGCDVFDRWRPRCFVGDGRVAELYRLRW